MSISMLLSSKCPFHGHRYGTQIWNTDMGTNMDTDIGTDRDMDNYTDMDTNTDMDMEMDMDSGIFCKHYCGHPN
jgi:hypothetical protein